MDDFTEFDCFGYGFGRVEKVTSKNDAINTDPIDFSHICMFWLSLSISVKKQVLWSRLVETVVSLVGRTDSRLDGWSVGRTDQRLVGQEGICSI